MSNDGHSGNHGEGGKKSQLILTLDHDTFNLVIGGEVQNFDVALAILGMATREIEAKVNAHKASISLAGRLPFNLAKGVRQ